MKILKIKKLKIKKTIWNLLFAYMNVRIQMKLKKSVTKFLKKKGISMFIKKNIQERNNLYVKFVKNVLLQMGIWRIIREDIMVKDHMNVIYKIAIKATTEYVN